MPEEAQNQEVSGQKPQDLYRQPDEPLDQFIARSRKSVFDFWTNTLLPKGKISNEQYAKQGLFRPARLQDESLENWITQKLLVDPSYVNEMQKMPGFNTDSEYFAYASDQAITAMETGNHGVGAVGVYTKDGKQLVITAPNELVSRIDTSAHAEQNIISAIEALVRSGNIDTLEAVGGRVLFTRSAEGVPDSIRLYTTLEPCPSCAQRIFSSGIFQHVQIGALDEHGGMFYKEKAKDLPLHFQKMAEHKAIDIQLASLPKEATNFPLAIFLANKKQVEQRPPIDTSKVGERGQAAYELKRQTILRRH